MNYLNKEELININGGGIALKGAYAIIGGAIVFIIGLVNGLVRPYGCSSNKEEVDLWY